ncbi:glycosyltransferase family 4 protein [Methylorubrum zatmanii]|uniref:Glycosyltransferase family 4 protein n=1 Tax=Methylorubrum zatmanii TaxID=29429 RepID=A0ABW1WXN5_9HYPH|nr:glycosyltransferase family 1 protein [Methylorubrum zatmanii]MBD8907056.1 glycosyl transferase family 1 [Methylorubrum zatmanii]
MQRVMPACLAIDLTRLITRLRHANPTGIDRVDLAYARHVLGSGPDGTRFGLVSTALGPRVLDRDSARDIVETVASGWVEDVIAEADPVFRALTASLMANPAAEARTPRKAGPGQGGASPHRHRLQAETMLRVLRSGGTETLPTGTVYLHTSHLRLDLPGRFDWLYTRRDVRPVFFVHDLIPISHPEYGRPGEAERHAARMETVARHAAHVLVNSRDVGARFTAYGRARGWTPKPVTVAPLGVEPVFSAGADGTALPRLARPTFLVCGTIEPRKNHLLLLNLWRDLAETMGEGTPRLVLIGRRGWEIENVADMLDRCPAIRAHVSEVVGLSTHGLAALMRGATALLMPSFIEGYGLPVVEAAASGLPVVASDIPVHREIGGDFAHLLDPLDGPGWTRAVRSLSEPASALRAELTDRLAGYRPPDWAGHFERVDAALADLTGP